MKKQKVNSNSIIAEVMDTSFETLPTFFLTKVEEGVKVDGLTINLHKDEYEAYRKAYRKAFPK